MMERTEHLGAQPWPAPSDEEESLTQYRASIYHFLSHLFLEEVSSTLLGVLRRPEIREDLARAGLVLDDLLEQDDEALLESLAVGYCASLVLPNEPGLFVNESCHRDGQLLGECTLDLEDLYAEHRLAVRGGTGRREMPDHIGVELEFMARLITAEAAAEARGEDAAELRATQARFLREHLLTWIPRYASNLLRLAPHPFYRRLGQLTAAFMAAEKELLQQRGAI